MTSPKLSLNLDDEYVDCDFDWVIFVIFITKGHTSIIVSVFLTYS